MKAFGLCLGASQISMAAVEKTADGIRLLSSGSRSHQGNVAGVWQEIINSDQVKAADIVLATGRKFKNYINVPSISEVEAVETAYRYLKDKYPGCDTIVSAGGETFVAYRLDSRGQIVNVHTGNKCAAGTGEFFLQQLKRMNLTIDEALAIVDLEQPYRVADRCSVFCKSDCTHALNKGHAKSQIVAGLCKMMAGKIIELLRKDQPKQILLIGGTARNSAMVEYIRRDLSPEQYLVVAAEAGYFEGLGAALWAVDGEKSRLLASRTIHDAQRSGFSFLPPITNFADKVTFKTLAKGLAQAGDECIVGLDVGSTTTKAVLMRKCDNALLASVYLRTNGDPVKAARACYQSLAEQAVLPIQITGLGVTGSGRQIAGLHAETEGVVNEIVAHATAAVHFDPEVDTIFEIGGQDAKYTYITNKVPADYAMNEACSAGTGSFLEESAKETMGIEMTDIAQIALTATKPPNFNDQCAAFISSDIKNAVQEGVLPADIIAGLVFSVCQNYVNRVKGNRPAGKKVFMQGGVCYNQAVPMAMAAISGKEIIVPPEPGLMGAYGVALEIKHRIEQGAINSKHFYLSELASREVVYGQPFICGGGREQCDRKCQIQLVKLGDREYPFGGACNKYVNMRQNRQFDKAELDYVAVREKLLWEKYAPVPVKRQGKTIGLIRSLLVNSLYPLYASFFTELGFQVVVADQPRPDGMKQKGAAFCYPVEQAHGFMADLLEKQVDYVFLPHVSGMPVTGGAPAVTCPLVQGEPYCLKTATARLDAGQVLTPILDFSRGYDALADEFVKIGQTLSTGKRQSRAAYRTAVARQLAFIGEMRELGRRVLAELESDPRKIGIVLFGRPYNAFARLANMGVPEKFASRGYLIIPWEFLPFETQPAQQHMFWAMGQMILQSAKLVKNHPRLFGAYITNFGCGPDSFIIPYFRNIMGQKPSLVLELDSHTADAGIDTRIEAFLDIVNAYQELPVRRQASYQMADIQTENGVAYVIDSARQKRRLTDQSIKLIVPSMGRIGSRLIAASLRYGGYNAAFLEPATAKDLAVGRAHSSCKECLPYGLVTGSILNDIAARRQNDRDEVLVYFFADSSGPCRFGQYHTAIRQLIGKNQIKNVVILPLTSDNAYAGLGIRFRQRAWQSIIIADLLTDIDHALLVLAQEKNSARMVFEQVMAAIEHAIASDSWNRLKEVLKDGARQLAAIPLTGGLTDAPKVALLGEIFVRLDEFSRQNLVARLAEKGMVTKVAPIAEFLYFCDYLLQKNLYHVKYKTSDRILSVLESCLKRKYEKTIKQILAQSGLCDADMLDVGKITGSIAHIIPPSYTAGEAVLTVAGALHDIIDKVSGVIAIGPFGCMPHRVAEAILTEHIHSEKPDITANKSFVASVMQQYPALPFLAVETDGNPFPPLMEAKLEIFCLQVARLHQAMLANQQVEITAAITSL